MRSRRRAIRPLRRSREEAVAVDPTREGYRRQGCLPNKSDVLTTLVDTPLVDIDGLIAAIVGARAVPEDPLESRPPVTVPYGCFDVR